MENTTEIMKNEEVIETTTEEIAEAATGKGLKIVAGVGLGVLAGYVIYKYVGKPIYAKIKAKKEAINVMPDDEVIDDSYLNQIEDDDPEETEE